LQSAVQKIPEKLDNGLEKADIKCLPIEGCPKKQFGMQRSFSFFHFEKTGKKIKYII
jgi:hypothetical protein